MLLEQFLSKLSSVLNDLTLLTNFFTFNRCCKCNDLTGGGVALLVVGIIVFWPIALIPCFMADCKNKNQIPIYGYPA